MTPKEKSIELINNFRDENLMFEKETLESAIKSSFESIDFIIKELNLLNKTKSKFSKKIEKRLDFWQNVKIELRNKLNL